MVKQCNDFTSLPTVVTVAGLRQDSTFTIGIPLVKVESYTLIKPYLK